MLVKGWKNKGKMGELFDKNQMTKIQKQLEKSQNTADIERMIVSFKSLKQTYIAQSNEQQNYFVLVDNSEVKQASIDKVDDWLECLGDILKRMATADLKQIIKETQDYERDMKGEMGDMKQLKDLLNVIGDIKNKSMDMEFRILQVQEQFRVLGMYDFGFDEETQKEVETLMSNWEELLEFADKKDFEVNDFKKNFAEVTKQEVESFKLKIEGEYEKYKECGPGTSSVKLEQGLDLLIKSKATIAEFNKEREENVLAEKLFNLPISKFPQLVQMEEMNKKYDQIYNIFKDF
jgi:dynein heavy chain